MSTLVCSNLTVNIAGKCVCKQLNLTVAASQFWGILGVNGVGKTTLLTTLNNIRSPDQGCVYIRERAVCDYSRPELARLTGMMLQEYEYNFPCTVLEAAMIGRHPHLDGWQWETGTDREIALRSLEKTGLSHLHDRQINTLSGGEKRRLNLATLITQQPDFFLLDEPTNHLDLKSQIDILQLMKAHFSDENKAGIMVIHDPNLAFRFCDHILLLSGNGNWQAGKTGEILNADNLSAAFGCSVQTIRNQTTTIFIPS